MPRSLIYTAPDEILWIDDEPRNIIFLAGGITGCNNWQHDVIERLKYSIDFDRYCIANPRRDDFSIDDKNEAFNQISWEFNTLEKCDIFSMYFVGSESDQPICMYELGRNVVRMKEKYPRSWKHRIIVSIEDGYKRADDVNIQLSLLGVMAFNNATPDIHAQRIAIATAHI